MPVPTAGGPEPQTLDEVIDWHQGVVEALVAQRTAVYHAATTGAAVPARFVGMTEDELDAYYDSTRRELDRLTVLNLVASAEATIRRDYSRRVQDRLKDPLARAYRAWRKTLSQKKRDRPDFDERGIIEVMKKADVMHKRLIGEYRECLMARHWVGHGRHWRRPVAVDRLDPSDLYRRCQALLQALPP